MSSDFSNESIVERRSRENAERIAAINAQKNAGRGFAPSINDAANNAGRFGMFESKAASDRERIEQHKRNQLVDFLTRKNGKPPTEEEIKQYTGGGNAA